MDIGFLLAGGDFDAVEAGVGNGVGELIVFEGQQEFDEGAELVWLSGRCGGDELPGECECGCGGGGCSGELAARNRAGGIGHWKDSKIVAGQRTRRFIGTDYDRILIRENRLFSPEIAETHGSIVPEPLVTKKPNSSPKKRIILV